MSAASFASPEDQKVTFVELFFDLVFVFSVTQVVSLFHDGIDLRVAGQAILAFWLVWWAWTQFTWALNAADTTHPFVAFGTLLATAVAFFMAVAVPDAFHGRALAFAIPYVLVRGIGLWLYAIVAAADPAQRAAVRSFTLVSLSGLVSVVAGGVADVEARYAFWGLTILLDVVAAGVGGRLEGWNLHPEHFAERHGLFVIIALGETLIVAAGGMTGVAWRGEVVAVAVLSVAVTCALWWSYFVRAKPALDHALERSQGSERSRMARDVFSLMHFPMLCGVVAYAAAIEEAIAHPSDPLTLPGRLALALGLALFAGGMAAARFRAAGSLEVTRIVLSFVTAVAVTLAAGVAPSLSLGIAFAGIAILLVAEHRRGG